MAGHSADFKRLVAALVKSGMPKAKAEHIVKAAHMKAFEAVHQPIIAKVAQHVMMREAGKGMKKHR